MESILVSTWGEWYYALLIAALLTFFGLVAIKLGDAMAALREIAINTRPAQKKEAPEIEYEEKYPRILVIRGFIFSTKGLFSFVGIALIVVGWIPLLVLIKQALGFN